MCASHFSANAGYVSLQDDRSRCTAEKLIDNVTITKICTRRHFRARAGRAVNRPRAFDRPIRAVGRSRKSHVRQPRPRANHTHARWALRVIPPIRRRKQLERREWAWPIAATDENRSPRMSQFPIVNTFSAGTHERCSCCTVRLPVQKYYGTIKCWTSHTTNILSYDLQILQSRP